MSKLVSVILLTYNQEETIARAIESVLEQVTDFEFDVLIMDDCSTDKTPHICGWYEQQYPGKICLFVNKKNCGPAANYKRGLLKVRTPYHAFLEGDDYWCDKNKLQYQVNLLEKNPHCTICGHDTLVYDVDRQEQPRLFSSYSCSYSSSLKEESIFKLENDFRVHPSSRLYRNIIDFTYIPSFMIFDTRLFCLYLLEGDLCYINRVMSVYNITHKGFWTGKNSAQKKLLSLKLDFKMNKFLVHYLPETSYYKLKGLKTFQKYIQNPIRWRLSFCIKVIRLYCKLLGYILLKPISMVHKKRGLPSEED